VTGTIRKGSAIVFLSILMISFTGLVVLLVIAPFAFWQVFPYHELNVWTIDKTVPYPDYREHAGFFWILKNEKISKLGAKQLYNEKSDYFGFYPYGKNEWRGNPLPSAGARPDIIYITDTYGVYKDDFMQKRLSGELSTKIYGGLNNDDITKIRGNLGAGNTFIAEFNTAASPTNLQDRQTLGRLLGISWKGWIGQYFEDLKPGKDVPGWVIANYEAQNKKKWDFFGRGFVLLSDDDRIEVLVAGKEIGPKGLKFSFREPWAKNLNAPTPISYRYWFEWTVPDPDTEIVADFTFDLNESGKAKLEALGLPDKFPAVVFSKNPQYSGWYFAGDFADLSFAPTPFRIAGISWLKKLLVDDTVDSNVYFYWKAYVPLIRSILRDAETAKKARAAIPGEVLEPKLQVRAFGKGFQIRDKDGVWKPFFVRGINIGMAEPGKYFTEFPNDIGTYSRWLDAIADMNANTVRIYTLPPPEFYKALSIHNTKNPGKPLFLLQEIWPEENPPNGDYLAKDYREGFLKEIDYGIDAVYGRANIPERRGRAWGIYTADVSRWILGWLVGRELEAKEVMETDSRNKGETYTGRFVSAGKGATPTEAWLAESLDEVATIEATRYGNLHPVALVSWPTLDPKEHDSEWDPKTGKKNKANDQASIAIDHFEITPAMTAGLFGAYHIYPNYPDFINNEAAYGSYKDEQGVLRYGGYLKEFMSGHGRYPALVAEFGLANGAGIAHFSPDGMNHGGNDETASGKGILRMLEAIKREGYAGGVIFEWMDEWVKKTWVTEFFMIPYDRHILWHNVVDPEQNYGLMANEVIPPTGNSTRYHGNGAIDSVDVAADAEFFRITVTMKEPPDFSRDELLIGLDTYSRKLGQTRWPVGNMKTSSGLEFLVRISAADKADLLVIPSYNTAKFKYATMPMSDGVFERMQPLINSSVVTKDGRYIPERRFDASALPPGAFDETGKLWHVDGNKVYLRLPWTLLNVTDPSSNRVLQDPRQGYYNPDRDTLKTAADDGIVVDAIAWDKAGKALSGRLETDPSKPYVWEGWETAPPYKERLKKSYFIVGDAWAKDAAMEEALK